MASSTVIADFLISRFPELGNRVRADASPLRQIPSGNPPLEVIDTYLTTSILRLVRYRPVEETLTDLATQIMDLHRRKEWKSVIQS